MCRGGGDDSKTDGGTPVGCRRDGGAGLGSEPRRVLEELSQIHSLDVVLSTRGGIETRKLCVTKLTSPSDPTTPPGLQLAIVTSTN